MADVIPASRLHPRDMLRVSGARLGSRKFRTALSTLGVTIGIAALVGVLGLSESSRADLLSELDALGTNLLIIEAGQGFGIGSGELPAEAAAMVERIGPVEQVSAVTSLDASVRRNDLVDPNVTSGINVVAADTNLLDTLNGALAEGKFLDDATGAYPNVVLGAVAAERLGISEVGSGVRVRIGGQWFTVIGILEPFPLAAGLDRSAIVGHSAAQTYLGADDYPSSIHVRVDQRSLDAVRAVLPATVNPEHPEEVEVSRPSDALAARAAADGTFTGLFLGLGAVALLVGGIGIANVMIIAVIERRNEIGLRRALGATRAHIRWQFLTEALVLAAMGGLTGVAVGGLVTAAYASARDWQIVVPLTAAAGGFGAALLIGAVAGLYPAMRAARLAPTDALRAT